jgi:hypothetical protein
MLLNFTKRNFDIGRVLVACVFQPSKLTVAALKKHKVPFEKLIVVGQKVAPISRIVSIQLLIDALKSKKKSKKRKPPLDLSPE